MMKCYKVVNRAWIAQGRLWVCLKFFNNGEILETSHETRRKARACMRRALKERKRTND